MMILSQKRFWLVVLLFWGASSISLSESVDVWLSFEASVFQTADSVVQMILAEDVDGEALQSLQDELSRLESRMPALAKQCPSEDVCDAIQYILMTARAVTDIDIVPDLTFSSDEQEKIAFLQQALHNYRTRTPVAQPDGAETAMEFQIGYAARPRGSEQFQDLKEGDVLSSGDVYKVFFIPGQTCHVYIFQVHSSGRVFELFPGITTGAESDSPLLNPVQQGQTYIVPAQNQSILLNRQSGKETLYFLAFLEPQSEFELLIDELQTAGRAAIVSDAELSPSASAGEGQPLSKDLKQYLEGDCEGCIQKLTFTHN